MWGEKDASCTLQVVCGFEFEFGGGKKTLNVSACLL